MVLPRLIHPVPVVIEQVSIAATVQDPDLEEPIGNVQYATAITLVGQVRWSRNRDLRTDRGGAKLHARGYVLFRQVDLTQLSINLQVNDRLTQLGNFSGRWWINSTEPQGHYPDQGGHSLIKAHFTDREPATT